jgi:hypothetical protein
MLCVDSTQTAVARQWRSLWRDSTQTWCCVFENSCLASITSQFHFIIASLAPTWEKPRRVLSLSDHASALLFIWRVVWGLYERAHIIRYFPHLGEAEELQLAEEAAGAGGVGWSARALDAATPLRH